MAQHPNSGPPSRDPRQKPTMQSPPPSPNMRYGMQSFIQRQRPPLPNPAPPPHSVGRNNVPFQPWRFISYPGPSGPMQGNPGSIIVNRVNATARFVPLNSYVVTTELIRPCSINTNGPAAMFNVNSVIHYLRDPNYKVLLRMCKFEPNEFFQMDHMYKAFKLCIGRSQFDVRQKLTQSSVDITPNILKERDNVFVKIVFERNAPDFANESKYFFGIYLVRKVELQVLLDNFKAKPPYPIENTINLVKTKRNDDDVALINARPDLIQVSLLCPFTSTRIKIPARSKTCDHVQCFDGEDYIKITHLQCQERQVPRWRCPHCRKYVILEDLIVDSLFLKILKDAPPNCDEAEIMPDGSFEYVQKNRASKATASTSSERRGEKREREDTREESPNKGNVKEEVVEASKQIEYITIGDSDDEDHEVRESSNAAPVRLQSTSNVSATQQEDTDSDLEIVYERLVTGPRVNRSCDSESSNSPASVSAASSSLSRSESSVNSPFISPIRDNSKTP